MRLPDVVRGPIGQIGRGTLAFLAALSNVTYLFTDTLRAVMRPFKFFPRRFSRHEFRYFFKQLRLSSLIKQMDAVGVQSLNIVFLINFFIGVILALQTAYQLERLGATTLVSGLVGVSLTRELAPLMTAILIAARVGAAFTAELGTMLVSEEVLALETMSISPVSYLVVPRFLGLMMMLPLLTVLAVVFGIGGGMVIGTTVLDISPSKYISDTFDAILLKDYMTGLIKSVVFAMIIVMVSCFRAFVIRGGAESVGRATMVSVVTSLVMIILADVIFTMIFYFVL